MRGHTLALLVVVALVMPAILAAGGSTIDATPLEDMPLLADAGSDALLQPGLQLIRRGDYTQAEQFYADLAARNSTVAPRALLLQARAALANADTDTAEATVQQLLSTYPGSDQTASAYFALEQIRRAAGDCSGALRALDAFESASPPGAIGPYAALQRAQCAAQLGQWSTELSAATAALSTEGGGPRLTRIEALERAAEAELKLGRRQEALDFYNRSLALAGTPAYTAEMLYTTATLARALGNTSLAAERFRAVVVDYGDQARGPAALDALIDMGRGDSISPLQAGLVRLRARELLGRHRVSSTRWTSTNPDWVTAQLNRAEALLKLNDEARCAGGFAVDRRRGCTPGSAARCSVSGNSTSATATRPAPKLTTSKWPAWRQTEPPRPCSTSASRATCAATAQGALAAWQSGHRQRPATARPPGAAAVLDRPRAARGLAAGAGRVQPVPRQPHPRAITDLRAQDRLDGSL